MESIYTDETYAAKNPDWHASDAPWKARQIEGLLQSNAVRYETALEIGCGTGDILFSLAERNVSALYTGYEISSHAYRRAALRESDRVSFRQGKFVPNAAGEFDLTLVVDVVEHVEDYLAFLKEIRGAGRFTVFHIPLDMSVQSVMRMSPIIGLRKSVGHLHYFSCDTALATLRDCGYRIIDWRYTASRLELPHQALSSRLMALPRRGFFAVAPDLTVRVLGGYSLLVLAA